jgi:hypothetical protein
MEKSKSMIQTVARELWASFTKPVQELPQLLKNMLDEFIKLKGIHKFVTLLLVVYFALPPLLYNEDPVQFHLIKLNLMYIIGVTLTLTVLIGYQHFPYLGVAWRKYRLERYLILIASGFMLFSLAINLPMMNAFVRNEIVSTSVFYGAGPNFISIFYYWLAFLLLFAIPVIVPEVPVRLIAAFVIVSLVITGGVIIYQIFIDNFMGFGRAYLFGFGNSNYTPDAFAIIGLYLLIPLLYEERISVWKTITGIYFFSIVLLSLSRASWVGLGIAVLGSIIYLIVTKKVHWVRIGAIAGLGILVMGALAGFLVVIGEGEILSDFLSLLSIFSGDADLADVSSFRTPLWGSAIEMWLYGLADGTEVFRVNFASILFGNGQSVYLWLEEGTQYLVTNVHQMFLDVLMSAGIVVFGIFIVLLVRQVKYSLDLLKQRTDYLVLFAGLLFIFGKWLFNSLNGLHAPFVYTVFILILAYHSQLKEQ